MSLAITGTVSGGTYTRDDHTYNSDGSLVVAPRPEPKLKVGVERRDVWVKDSLRRSPILVTMECHEPRMDGRFISIACPMCHSNIQGSPDMEWNGICCQCVSNLASLDNMLKNAIEASAKGVVFTDISVRYEVVGDRMVDVFPRLMNGARLDLPGRTVGNGNVVMCRCRCVDHRYQFQQIDYFRSLFSPPGEGATEDDARRYINWHNLVDNMPSYSECPYEKRGSK